MAEYSNVSATSSFLCIQTSAVSLEILLQQTTADETASHVII